MTTLSEEIYRRKNFAIISHPDAGKTTLTEKLLLYGGAIQLAGAVKSKKNRKSATSDWMDMEKEKGISITSAALQFEYKNFVLNLLDTPGHDDFSEDTYRTLMASDSAVMLIDAGKGVEPQTIKLFKVCRDRGIPILTFINKMDRPTKNIFSLMDEIEKILGITCIPIFWPVGKGIDFTGIYSRKLKKVYLFQKAPGGSSKISFEEFELNDPILPTKVDEFVWREFQEDLDLIETGLAEFDQDEFLNAKITPVFFGSAINNIGVEIFLDEFLKIGAPPIYYPLENGEHYNPIANPFSGIIFKIQANMNKMHRDRIAFMRICSGIFERGINVNHNRLNKQVKLSSSFAFFGQDRNVIDIAYPGDVIGLINPGTFKIGDILSTGTPPHLKPIPKFAPELFATISTNDTNSLKGFKKGIEQLSEEGILHLFYSKTIGTGQPIIGAMGQLQFEVFQRRLEDEYRSVTNIQVLPFQVSRWIKSSQVPLLPVSVKKIEDRDGRVAILFESEWEMNYFKKNNEEIELLDYPEN